MSTSKRVKPNEASFHISEDYLSDEFKKQFKTAWSNENQDIPDCTHLKTTPFPCSMLSDFVVDEDGKLLELKEELMRLKFHQKNNDLYQFKQSNDLKCCSAPHIKAFCELLNNQCLSLIRDVTGIPLNNTVDATCSKYEYTDVLLCHDDRLEGRRIAFIYYLVPPSWCEKDGGSLDLFSANDHYPVEVVRSLVPTWNSFVFFEVSPSSFHQVSEVLSGSKTRLSINGWFHGPPTEYPAVHDGTTPMAALVPCDVSLLEAWINPIYLDVGTAAHIREEFEENSQIELQCFLLEEKYELLHSALDHTDMQWRVTGAPNKQRLHSSKEEEWPQIVQELMSLMQSKGIGLLLAHLTGVELVNSEPATDEASSSSSLMQTHDALCCGRVLKIQEGSYSLVHDSNVHDISFYLDGMLYFGATDWSPDCGGFTSYIARDEDEELLTVVPAPNSLALVYRDKDTLEFLKYVNSRVNDRDKPYFYMAALVYQEHTNQ